jgi:hypothetical protein
MSPILVPKPGKIFMRWDDEHKKLVEAQDVTMEDLDRNFVYEMDAEDVESARACPYCERVLS